MTQLHQPLAFLAGLGDSPLLKQNIDYIPSICRGLLYEAAPWMMVTTRNAAGEIHQIHMSVPWQIVLYLSAGAIAGIVVSLLTPRTPDEKLDHFFALLRTPVRSGEKVHAPCTLPDDHLPTQTEKLLPFRDIELPKPTLVGMGGFAIAWVLVGLIIWGTGAIAQIGG